MLGASIAGVLKKVPLVVWVVVIAGGYFWWSQKQINGLKSDLSTQQLSETETTAINDSLSARIASESLAKDSLGEALAAEKEFSAELIAAARIRIQPDPVSGDSVVPDTMFISNDRTRVAQFTDSTEAGVLEATVTAPPCCAKLKLDYLFTPAIIDPVVSLLRTTDNTAIFAVTYRGGTTEIEAPFARLPEKPKKIEWNLAAMYDLAQSTWNVRGGVTFLVPMVPKLFIFAQGQQPLAEDVSGSLYVGVEKRF
jgi:hypothetical protein